MAIPSRLMGSGLGSQAANNICGDVAAGLTATGSSASDALQLSAVNVQMSTVSSSTGVKLPPAEAGAVVLIRNSGLQTLTIYPQSGSTIDGSTSTTIATARGILLMATSNTTWFTLKGA